MWFFLHAVKSCLLYFFPSDESLAADCYRAYKYITSIGFEAMNIGSNSKHANHYTTEATYIQAYYTHTYFTILTDLFYF
jgi:hypothetical protein